MRVDLLSIMKMTDEELARALSVPSQEPLDELDQIALRQALEEERERRARSKIQKEAEGERERLHEQKLAAVAAMTDDELAQRLRVDSGDRDLIKERGRRRRKTTLRAARHLRPRFEQMTDDQLVAYANGPHDDAETERDLAAAISELKRRTLKMRQATATLEEQKKHRERRKMQAAQEEE
jgi:hypothetical protein